MKRIIKMYLLGAAVTTLVWSGCRNQDYDFYKGESYLYFGPALKWSGDSRFRLEDTLKRTTFYYDEDSVIRDTIYFDLYTIGQIADHDRIYQLEQEVVKEHANAVAGIDYVGFDDPRIVAAYVMRAGQYHTRVPIVLMRSPVLKKKEVVLKFKVKDNANFKKGNVETRWRKVIFSDRLSRPAAWDQSMEEYYLGKYSLRKHEFMIEVTGESWNQAFIEKIQMLAVELDYWVTILRRAVADYNRNHEEPLRDPETNELIFF